MVWRSTLIQEKLRKVQTNLRLQLQLENEMAKNSKLTVVLLTLLALQLAPESIYLPKNEGRSQVEVAEGPIRNLRVWTILMVLILPLWMCSKIKSSPLGYITFQNHSDLIWLIFVFYLWAQSLFLNGGTPISNLLLGNLMISKEDCKTNVLFGNFTGTFCLDKQFHLKNRFVAENTYNEVDEFCWQLRDGIIELIENQVKFRC